MKTPQTRTFESAFSLVEMLVATAILSFLLLILISLTSQSSQVWSTGTKQGEHRQKARSTLDFIGREMRLATVAVDGGGSLRFVIYNQTNPGISTLNPHAVFWLAPVATETSMGDLAEVGYFIRWDTELKQSNLCRMLVNPSDTAHYLIYTSPENWITDALLLQVAPGTKASGYQGLFLENVLGLWVKAYRADGTDYGTDSSSSSNRNKLPAYVDISLVFLDSMTAKRLQNPIPPKESQSPEDYIAALPISLKSGATRASLRVILDNNR